MTTNTASYNNTDTISTPYHGVTHCMVRARTVELAVSAGRRPIDIRQRDYEQAKRELTGESDLDRQLAILYPKQ